MMKCFPWSAVVVSPVWTALRLGWHAYAAWRGHGGAGRALEGESAWRLMATVGRAYLAAARGVPAMVRQRRERHATSVEFRGWLRYHGVSARDVALTE
jgi:hypothetical protein